MCHLHHDSESALCREHHCGASQDSSPRCATNLSPRWSPLNGWQLIAREWPNGVLAADQPGARRGALGGGLVRSALGFGGVFYDVLSQSYDEPGPLTIWTFLPQKRSLPAPSLAESVADLLSAELATAAALRLWLRRSLWGNRADLSNQTVAIDRHHYAGEDDRERLLIDDTAVINAHLVAGRVKRLDLIADNSGPELCADLVLLDFLLRSSLVGQVQLHLKSLPFFVSDAMIADVAETIAAMRGSPCVPIRELAARLEAWLASGQLELQAHGAWASPLLLDALPADLLADLAGSDLLLLKGDANYRRVLADRHWPPTTALEAITAFMPTSFVLLRTLKSELVVGLAAGQAETRPLVRGSSPRACVFNSLRAEAAAKRRTHRRQSYSRQRFTLLVVG